MMKKKLVSSMLCAAMAVSMLAGCGDNETTTTTTTTTKGEDAQSDTAAGDTAAADDTTAAAAETTLKVAVFEGGYGADMWTEVCSAFEKAVPGVKVELTIDKKIEDVISPSMKAGDYPDVVHCATGREAGLTETLTKEKQLMELTDVINMTVPGETVTVKDKILPGFLDTLGTNPYNDGVTYYAPMFYSPCGLFYDANLLKENGWDVPKTWDEMFELGDKAKEKGIALFTYPTAGYFDAFLYALLQSSGGTEFYNKCMTYEDGIWESAEAKAVFDLVTKLKDYTESTTVANANDDNYKKNQQLILDGKAIFCPNGTWLPDEMKDAPRSDGFQWGFTAVPAVNKDNKPSSFTFFEQIWIPKEAKNPDMAKQFIAYMYSDEAAAIFAKSNAVQPIDGVSAQLSEENQLYYQVYDNDAAMAVMGGFAATQPVEGVTMKASLFEAVNSVMSGDKTEDDWIKGVEDASDQLRAAME